MMDILRKCESVIGLGPESEVDEYAVKEMKKMVKSHLQRKKPALAELSFVINNRPYDSLLDTLLELDSIKSVEIRFLKPNIHDNWDFNAPTKIIKAIEGGYGGLAFFNYDAKALDKWAHAGELIEKKAMIRAFPVDFYVPRSIATMSRYVREDPPRPLVPRLLPMEKAWVEMREVGALPLTVRICAYTHEERFSYDLDLIEGVLMRDFRAERMPVTRKKRRSPEEYFYFDNIYASTDLPILPKQIFEAIFESDGLTASDISHFFKITMDMALNNLRALVSRGLVESEGRPPFETYRVTFEALKASQ